MLLNVIFCLIVSQASLINGYQDFLLANDLLGDYFGVPGMSASYDYVVIGGGTAGLTIARRLAAHASVAVIEAGDFYQFSNGNNSEIPAYASAFTGSDPTERNPVLDWYQYTQPQAVCLSMNSKMSAVNIL